MQAGSGSRGESSGLGGLYGRARIPAGARRLVSRQGSLEADVEMSLACQMFLKDPHLGKEGAGNSTGQRQPHTAGLTRLRPTQQEHWSQRCLTLSSSCPRLAQVLNVTCPGEGMTLARWLSGGADTWRLSVDHTPCSFLVCLRGLSPCLPHRDIF